MTERPLIFSAPGSVPQILAGAKTETRRVITRQNSLLGSGRWQDIDLEDSRTFADRGFANQAGEYTMGYLHAGVRGDDSMARVFCAWAPADQWEQTPEPGYRPPARELWVREAWRPIERSLNDAFHVIEYRDGWTRKRSWGTASLDARLNAREVNPDGCWRSPIFMPRWASRVTLRVLAVWPERLLDITNEGARAEGIPQTAGEAALLGMIDPLETPGHEWDNRTSRGNYLWLWDRFNKKTPSALNGWVWATRFEVVQ